MGVFKVGVVSEIDPVSGMARVAFADLDGMESMLIPVGVRKSGQDKDYWMPDVGEHVSCLLDVNAEGGVILSAIYSDADAPPVMDADKRHIRFADGTWLEYDRKTHKWRMQCVGDIEVTCAGDASVECGGRLDARTGGEINIVGAAAGQVKTTGVLHIESETRLVLKGPSGVYEL